MDYLIVNDANQINKSEWTRFVANHQNGNVFHTPEMFEVHCGLQKYKPLFLSCVNPQLEIKGILIAFIYKEYGGLFGRLSSRAIVWGGPLVYENDPELTNLLVTEFIKICKKEAIYSQFRNLWDTHCFQDIFIRGSYKYEDHLNFLFDLTKGEKYLWEKIHPTRKKQINRSIKRGLNAQVVDHLNQIELEECYAILEQVYRVARLPYPDIVYFQKAFQVLGSCGFLKTILATFEDRIIGFRFFLSYKGLLYDWYAGSITEHHDKYPNDLLPWELMKWGIVNGYNTFDFGGAGKPEVPYGVREYKMKFGGELVNFGRYEKVHKSIMMILGKAGYKLWRLLRTQ